MLVTLGSERVNNLRHLNKLWPCRPRVFCELAAIWQCTGRQGYFFCAPIP